MKPGDAPVQDAIRNFCIIAHIDHGKSTLADRFLELTKTVEQRVFRNQYLDQMDLERERGITIKLQPVRMMYACDGKTYMLNLVDTPGHVDFSYEVSRSLAAVEGAVLLVDVSQGIQAQTLANLHFAQKQGLHIIGALNKIDLPHAQHAVDELRLELAHLLGQSPDDILLVSGKTGQGADALLRAIVQRIPSPEGNPSEPLKALIFDSLYDAYKGAIAFVRIVDGNVRVNDSVYCMATQTQAPAIDIGIFRPALASCVALRTGEIGYIATGIKDPNKVRVGDTITRFDAVNVKTRQPVVPLPGYQEPQPVVFVSMYPNQMDDIDRLADALNKLKLNDASLFFTRERQEMLGQGFRVGCLGTLHLEILKERLLREYGLEPIITAPSVKYEAELKNGLTKDVFTPSDLPSVDHLAHIREPWVHGEIITPSAYLGGVLGVIQARRGVSGSVDTISLGNVLVHFDMPLGEIILDFYDRLKSVSQGYASVSYEITEWKQGDLVKLDIVVHGELVDAFSRIVPKEKSRALGLSMIEKLKDLLPPEVFAVPIQAAIGSEIIARVTLAASRKNVTGHLYGGDRTRKMKLWKKQQKGKKRRALYGKVDVPPSVFFDVFQVTKNE